MRIAVNYIHVVGRSADPTDHSRGAEFWPRYHERFVRSLRQFRPGVSYDLHVTLSGAARAFNLPDLYDGFEPVFHFHDGSGRDIGGNQATALALVNQYDLILCLASSSHVRCDNWLKVLVDAYCKHGDGVYAPMTSYERTPHIRASVFLVAPKTFAEYPHLIDTYEKTRWFESGGLNDEELGRYAKDWLWPLFFDQRDKPALMVTADGQTWKKEDWRKPPNIFRRGDQSNCCIWDRHNDVYAASNPETKRGFEIEADLGGFVNEMAHHGKNYVIPPPDCGVLAAA